MGPSSVDEKIRHDTFRTMSTDSDFVEHVSEDMLIRLLNAFVWTSDDSLTDFFQHRNSVSYVQGMNVLAAPFLMTMPEMEAFFSFSTFIYDWCPLYVLPTMKGVHCGLRVSSERGSCHVYDMLIEYMIVTRPLSQLSWSHFIRLFTRKKSICQHICICM